MADMFTRFSSEEDVVPNKKRKLNDDPVEDECIILSDDDESDFESSNPTNNLKIVPNPKIEISNGVELIPLNSKKSNAYDLKKVEVVKDDHIDVDQSEINDKRASETESTPKITSVLSEKQEPPNSKTFEDKFSNFCDTCLNCVRNDDVKQKLTMKIPKLKHYCEELFSIESHQREIIETLAKHIENMNKIPQQAITYFCDFYKWAKLRWVDLEKVETLGDDRQYKLNKLNTALEQIQVKIQQLDKIEVDFDDEENSSYLQLCRYKERASQIYDKICEIKKQNPNYGNLLYSRIDFSHSKYPAINQAINRKYKNVQTFPTYFDLNKCIRKCLQQKQVDISEHELEQEIKRCFEELGNLMQKKRKLDLLNIHNSYVETNIDPATSDNVMEHKLRQHRTDAENKLKAIMENYVKLQEEGMIPEISSESDDSNMTDSDCQIVETVN